MTNPTFTIICKECIIKKNDSAARIADRAIVLSIIGMQRRGLAVLDCTVGITVEVETLFVLIHRTETHTHA